MLISGNRPDNRHNEINLNFSTTHFQKMGKIDKKPSEMHILEGKVSNAFMDIIGITREVSPRYMGVSAAFTNMHHHMSDALINRIFSKIDALSEDEKYLFKFLYKKMDLLPSQMQYTFAEILKGAYIQFDDGGAAFDDWKVQLKGKTERSSSHKSLHKQYSIQGELIGEHLFSDKLVEDPITGKIKRCSWFQLERHPTTLRYLFLHMVTWVMYKFTGMNYGPFGRSKHRENSNPLVIKLMA